jgi:molybdopterin converting factor subunit 1
MIPSNPLSSETIQIAVSYFALLKEQAQKEREVLVLNPTQETHTCNDLWQLLSAQYGFTLTASQMRVAINDAFVSWDTSLKTGDHVVFIPPVAGG